MLSDTQLHDIACFAGEKDLPIISDDIYDRMIYDGHRFTSIASFPEAKDRTVILNGLSKTYAMTGWRSGYIIAPDKPTYTSLWNTQMAAYLVIPEAIQHASIAALTGPQDCVEEMKRGYRRKRDYAYDVLTDLKGVHLSKPKGAFYLFPDISDYGVTSAKMTAHIRETVNLGITDGSLFGKQGEGHIRISYAQSMDNLERGLERLKEALRKL